ncbi:hypothetical protein FOA52_004511 [Chlamydomonas sp. UWO 241]|nr:hypothetical protein FOA52_004511 [Chlamydomonas sp. UWO 241]
MADNGTSFSFGFAVGQEGAAAAEAATQEAASIAATQQCLPAVEERDAGGASTRGFEDVAIAHGLSLLKGSITGAETAALLGDNRVEGNDLIPGLYEGGFKLWEGAIDLCRYLMKTFDMGSDLLTSPNAPQKMRGKKVLELGCGHGLPGILCMLAGAVVHFQDYNCSVLTELTMPNVHANVARLAAGRPVSRARYFSGDWSTTGDLLATSGLGGYYDYVLTAEGIYSVDSHVRLIACIKQVLQPPMGVAFVAAKTYYFGVGGGTKAFTSAVLADGVFEVEAVEEIEETASGNKREIIELRFPDSIAPYFL